MRNEFYFIKNNIAIILIIALGFFLRIHRLGTGSFWFDETISSIAAISILENGTPVLPSGFFYGRAILNTLLIALSFSFFGVNEFAGRFPSVIFGSLTIFLVYHMSSRWGTKRIGIIAALLVAFSVWEIAWSRQARMYQQLQFFYILSIYLFYEYFNSRNKKYLILLIASFASTVLTHVFGYALIAVFILFLTGVFMKQKRKIDVCKQRSTLYLTGILFFLLGIVYHEGIIYHVLQTRVNYYDEYIYLLKECLAFSLFAAIPGATLLIDKDWNKGLLIMASIIIPLYVIFFHVLLFGIRYLYFVVPLVFILASYFIDFIIEQTSQVTNYVLHTLKDRNATSPETHNNIHQKNKYIQHYLSFTKNPSKTPVCSIIIVALILMMHLSPAFTFVPQGSYDLGPNAPLSDFKRAYSYVGSSMGSGDVVISTWTAPAQFYLGKNDYWLAFNVVGTGMGSFTVKNGSRDIYSNSVVLNNTEMLENVTQKHERGWIVTDNIAWKKLSSQSRGFIQNETEEKLHGPSISVYMWDHTNRSTDYRH